MPAWIQNVSNFLTGFKEFFEKYHKKIAWIVSIAAVFSILIYNLLFYGTAYWCGTLFMCGIVFVIVWGLYWLIKSIIRTIKECIEQDE